MQLSSQYMKFRLWLSKAVFRLKNRLKGSFSGRFWPISTAKVAKKGHFRDAGAENRHSGGKHAFRVLNDELMLERAVVMQKRGIMPEYRVQDGKIVVMSPEME